MLPRSARGLRLRRFLTGVALLFSTFNLSLSCLAQGDLTPSGPPAPSMKSLDQLEPRVILNSNSAPGDATSLFRITNPGSYYLASNVVGVPGKHGIVIAAPYVTLDLHGFALLGVPGSFDGINATNPAAQTSGLTVRNGIVGGWGGSGINTQSGAPGAHFSRLSLLTNALSGLRATSAVISDCVAIGNTSGANTNYGFHVVSSVMVDCVARTNSNGIQGSGGSTIERCSAADNAFGLLGDNSQFLHCSMFNNSSAGMFLFSNNRVSGNIIDGNNKGIGINLAGSSTGNTLDGNVLINNPTAGITFVQNPSVTGNFMLRNAAHGSGTNSFLPGSGNAFGPIVSVAGSNDVSTVTNASHPLANFAY